LPIQTTISLWCAHAKPPKVVFIAAAEHRLLAVDQKSHRLIVGIGSQRFAIDYFTRIRR
jgi:hypothetical protein